MLAGLAAGLALGLLAAGTGSPSLLALAEGVEPAGTLFMNAIQMVVIPLVMTSIFTGVASLGDTGRVGRLGGIAVAFFWVTAIPAILLGMGTMRLGLGFAPPVNLAAAGGEHRFEFFDMPLQLEDAVLLSPQLSLDELTLHRRIATGCPGDDAQDCHGRIQRAILSDSRHRGLEEATHCETLSHRSRACEPLDHRGKLSRPEETILAGHHSGDSEPREERMSPDRCPEKAQRS